MDALQSLSTALTGRYSLHREIGAGGMATVYLARDVRHDRKVALKVLRPELGAVLGVERFLAEIKVTANLQHPNLLPLFDSGEANGLLFYVMPFVEGETLRARLQRERQLPVEEAVRITLGIASALHYAHEHGVIHRDLKPENILLQAGQPVVADFGIALAVSNAGGTRVTQTGLSLGTPQYMSPEQATSDHTIDGRTDIYSLGAMLYEMLTGEPPHIGNSAQAIIARVLTDKPRSVRLVRDTVPPQVEASIDKALAKLPADRFSTPNEFAEALQGRMVLAATGAAPTARASRAWAAGSLPWVGAFLLATAAAAWGWLGRPAPAIPPTVRFELAFPRERGLAATGTLSTLELTPDGRRIVYNGLSAGGRQLFVRDIDQLEARPLAGTQSASMPSVSPDGRWVAWSFVGRLRKTPIDGGASVEIGPAPRANSIAWISNDELVVSASTKGGFAALWRIPASGGELRPFTQFDSATREGFQQDPVVLREHGLVLYTSNRLGSLIGRLGVARLDGSTRILNLLVDRVLGYALGHVIYIGEDGALMAAPFDTRSLETRGAPIALAQGLARNAAALSASGTLAHSLGSSTGEVVMVDDRGASSPLVGEPGRYAHPRLSPDGKRLAIDITSGSTTDLWTFDVASGTPTRQTTSDNNDRPEWTTDGTRLLYLSTRGGGNYSVWSQLADGSGPAEELFRGPNSVREVQPTPDARVLIYREDHPDSLRDIRLASLDKKDSPTPLVATRFDELMPRLSPDGRWLAYQSDESGQYEIYVRPFPAGGGRITISNGGGSEPLWSRDGRLFYRKGQELIAIGYSTNPGFAITSRRVLFSANFDLHPYHPNYDVTADGRRFVMIKPGNQESQVVVIVNWIEELRRRLGTTP
ncbi:MAG: protein kinase domain-containing protein [Longimicrobiales bacterium]